MNQESTEINQMLILNEKGLFDYHEYLVDPVGYVNRLTNQERKG